MKSAKFAKYAAIAANASMAKRLSNSTLHGFTPSGIPHTLSKARTNSIAESFSQKLSQRKFSGFAYIKEERLVKDVLKNIGFATMEILADPEKTKDHILAAYKNPILKHPRRSSLGGEHVVTLKPSDSLHPGSSHVMYFEGDQEKHAHLGGPRKLVLRTSDQECSVFIGPILTESLIKGSDKLPMVEIIMPKNSTIEVHLAQGALHGFKGYNVGADSIHHDNVAEAKTLGIKPEDLGHKDVMARLTNIPDQSRINIVRTMGWEEAQRLQQSASLSKA